MKLIDLVGKKFGRLTVLSRAPNDGKHTRWNCACDCSGKNTVVHSDSLKNGATKSCGCLRDEMTAERSLTHGNTVGRKSTREYRAWSHIKDRCYAPTCERYPRYGGRGIKVCERWLHSFETFLKDMGICPEKYTIERLNTNGNYEPSNCVWADAHTQSRNRSDNVWLEYKGELLILKDWASKLGIDNRKLHALIQYEGKTLAEVINEQL